MIAVSNTGPFLVRWPLALSSRATLAGSLISASALASRRVGVFSPTSSMVGRLAASRCVSLDLRATIAGSPADVIHFDLGARIAGAQFDALFAVAVLAVQPRAAHQPQHLFVVGTTAQRAAQVHTGLCEQAGVEAAVRRQSRARAAAAE